MKSIYLCRRYAVAFRNQLKKTYMNKKDYVAPSVEVVVMEIQESLLAGSGSDGGTKYEISGTIGGGEGDDTGDNP